MENKNLCHCEYFKNCDKARQKLQIEIRKESNKKECIFKKYFVDLDNKHNK